MALRNVLTFPHPNLRKMAKPIEKVTPEIQLLLDDMLETMYAEQGIGLAATQIDVHLRAVVMDLSDERNEPLYIVNPEIIEKEGMQDVKAGCLSVPGIYDAVSYPAKVTVRFLDREGRSVEMQAEKLLAACFQHEIDHLNGKLFIDYLSPLKRDRIEKKLAKMAKVRL
jgi:peptide deformylase